jgi:PAP2 superfamily
MKRLQLNHLMFALAAAGLVACGGGGDSVGVNTPAQPINQPYQASTVVVWNSVALDAVRTGTLGPPAVARALGMVHTAMFDAWAAFDERAVAVTAGAPAKRAAAERTDAAKSTAISMAAYRVLLDLYPAQKDKLDAALKAQGLAPEMTSTTDGSLAAVGNTAAAAVIAFRRVDGSNQSNGYADTSAYAPVNTATALKDVNYWQPQTFCNGKTPGYLLPHWGTVAPFALANGAAVRPTQGPAKMGEPKFMQQALDVLAISAGLNEYQKTVAEYWADGPASETPPGHWMLFAQSASAFYRYSLDQDAMLYMAMGNAMHDAGIATWDAKRAYNSARPITTIRELFKDQTVKSWSKDIGIVEVKGQEWQPYQPCTFITPPFAEYTSGHSAFSAAGAEVLKRYTGSDNNTYTTLIKAGTLKTESNIPSKDVTVSWPTFTAAADEAGMSRRFGGIHFEDGDIVGRKIGRDVADQVWKKAQTHFNR